MPDTKTIVAKVTLGIPCPRKSVLRKDDKGQPVTGEYAYVELKHVEPGKTVTLLASEADDLIARGHAEEKVEAKPAAKA